MNGGVIRTVILSIVLVVFSFLLGSHAADGTKTPLIILAVLCGFCVINYLGKRSWWLLFVLPPVLELVPMGVARRLPMAYICSALVLFYWLIMWIMGYVKLTWNGVRWMDCVTGLVLLYMAYSYMQHPVSMRALGLDVDEVGGEPYFWALFAAFYYMVLSCIPFNLSGMVKVLRFTFWICILASLVAIALTVAGKGGGPSSMAEAAEATSMGEDMSGSRFGMFMGVSFFIGHALFSAYPITLILISPWKLGLLLLSFVGVALSGFRTYLVTLASAGIFMSIVWRRFLILLLLIGVAYGVLLVAGSQRHLERLPFGVQRSLCIIPGVQVKPEIARNAQGSSDWRFVMWKWAFDPRLGYIKDYVWGDGFAQSLTTIQRESSNQWRGTLGNKGDQKNYAERGLWHSGPITCIHRLGYVGLGLMSVWMLAALFLIFRCCLVLRGVQGGFYIMLFTIGFVGDFVAFYLSTGSSKLIFSSFSYVALAKVVYSILVKEGKVPPFFSFKRYVPMTIRESEEAAPRAAAEPRFSER